MNFSPELRAGTVADAATPDNIDSERNSALEPSSVLARYAGLVRLSHTVFALPFALLASVLAWQTVPFRLRDLIGILLCMVFARSAAMAFNRLVDRKIDADNPRTADRHLPAGLVSKSGVIAFTFGNVVAFVLSTLLFLPNTGPLWLSGPVLLFLCGYSLAKRFTWLCHYWLSAALMCSPIAAWFAITGGMHVAPVWLAGAIFFWVGGFDILYACQDAAFDRESGLHSVPARFGIPTSLRIAAVSHLLTAGCLVGFWWASGFGLVFGIAVLLVIGLLVYEHALVRPDDLSRVGVAFFNINAIISLGLFAAGLLDLLLVSR